jgi:transmembrane sensor
MSERRPFFEGIATEQDALRGRSAAKTRLLARIDALPAPKADAASRRVTWALAAAAVCAMAVVGVWFSTRERALEVRVGSSATQALVGAWLGAPDDEPLPLEFSDGTRIELEPRARARVRDVRANGAHLELDSGRMHLHVTPRRGARWRLDVGPFGVEVTGTRFDVSYSKSDDRFELTLEEGEVILHGCVFGGGRKLAPGQTVRASCREPSLAIGYGRADASEAPKVAESVAAPPKAAPSARVEVTTRDEVAPSEPKAASADELLVRADTERRAGGSARAAEALREVRKRFPGSRAAALAAFKLGRLEFDGNGAYGRAAEWFHTYLREDPGGPMTREALGRLLESFERAGARGRAKEFALRYRRDYPSGPHAELAARIAASP